jgi:hypothetical protein
MDLIDLEGAEIFLEEWESDFSDARPDRGPPPNTPPLSPTLGPSLAVPDALLRQKRGNYIRSRIRALTRFDDNVLYEKITAETGVT